MTVYVSIAIEGVEPDADIAAIATHTAEAVQEAFIYFDVSLNEVESV